MESTQSKQIIMWKHWQTFLMSIGFHHSVLIHGLTSLQQNIIIYTFPQEIREVSLSGRNSTEMVKGTVNAAISHGISTFRTNKQTVLRLNIDKQTCFLLQQKLRAFKNKYYSSNKKSYLSMIFIQNM